MYVDGDDWCMVMISLSVVHTPCIIMYPQIKDPKMNRSKT